MLQLDARPDNRCTCLLFMRPTANIKQLLEGWMRSIVGTGAGEDQVNILVTFESAFDLLENAPMFWHDGLEENLQGSLESRKF